MYLSAVRCTCLFFYHLSFTHLVLLLQLGSGRGKARAEDYNLIKTNIGQMYTFHKFPGDSGSEKALRGFHHSQIAVLLAPYNLDLTDPM